MNSLLLHAFRFQVNTQEASDCSLLDFQDASAGVIEYIYDSNFEVDVFTPTSEIYGASQDCETMLEAVPEYDPTSPALSSVGDVCLSLRAGIILTSSLRN